MLLYLECDWGGLGPTFLVRSVVGKNLLLGRTEESRGLVMEMCQAKNKELVTMLVRVGLGWVGLGWVG